MKKTLLSLLGIWLCLLLAAPAGAAGRTTDRGATAAKARGGQPSMADLKKAANRAAGKLAKAQADVARLNDQITVVARQVDKLNAEIVPLKKAVTRRTTAVYKAGRGFDAVAGLSNQQNPVKTALGAKMVSGANNTDGKAIARLKAAMAELELRQEQLVAKRTAQETALARLDGERQALEKQLSTMAQAERDLQARIAKAQQASARSSRTRRRPVAAPAVDPASIPVVTDFICPIIGPKAFTNSWGDPRSGGRRHQGTDMMSPRGTVNVAVVSGTFERHHSGAGGLAVYLYGDDGHTYYYAHLDEVIGSDRRVAQGEPIGKTGSTGNARGGSPHTHFEFHPNGGRAVNSYPMLKAACG